MAPLTFAEARARVLAEVRAARSAPSTEAVPLEQAAGRVLAEAIAADRDSPALARSVRDGYAVRAADLPGDLQVIGEVRAGDHFTGTVGPGQAVEIMTGAPMPVGADAVVMVEYTRRTDDRMQTESSADPGQNINPRACEAAAGDVVLHPGKRLDYTDVAMLATFGHPTVTVYARPRVAIIATGDEIVEVDKEPQDFQIRNSNAQSLYAQVLRAGGIPQILPVARDTVDHTREIIERGLASDLLLLSGGVSAGKYDVVEPVLSSLGAEFFFDRVLIQPGQPLVFGRAAGTFFFGLPGNPSSTMVTFEIFARAALELLSGQMEISLQMPFARLTRDFRHRAGLTRFLPARLSIDGSEVTPLSWHGSGDVPALTRANVYLVTDPDRPEYAAGDLIRILMKMKKLSHYDSAGSPRMVDVSAKSETRRTAGAHAFVKIAPKVLAKLPHNPKGNPLEIARIAGITAAKRTSELIPMCHPLMLTHADVHVAVEKKGVRITSTAATTGQTGVEMEALTAAAVAALTVYDMVKALDKGIEIQDVYLLEKTGGKSGGFKRKL